MSIYYEIELLSDTAFKPRSAGGLGLDFCPGGVVLGHVARAYAKAEKLGLAWTVFHGGDVRFSDARVADAASGRPAVVWPLSFHAPKGALGEWLGLTSWVDGAAGTPIPTGAHDRHGVQASVEGRRLKVGVQVDLKTAVDYDTQRAEEGKLFQVRTLPAGTRLWGKVEATGPQAAAALAFVRAELFGRATLGWSRRAEYGRALIKESTQWAKRPGQRTCPPGEVTFLLLSEACLLGSATGQPTLTPEPAHFGINPDARLVGAKTFLRGARWTPFNAYRKRPDVERVALAAGSIITFSGVTTPARAIADYVGQGIGLGRAEGLGAVWLNPPPLGTWVSGRASAPSAPTKVATVQPMPGDALGRWLLPRREDARIEERAWDEHLNMLASLRHVRGVAPAQWRRVASEARAAGRVGGVYLSDAIIGADGVCCRGVARHRWDKSGGLKRLERLFEGKTAADAAWLPRALALAAERMARVAGQEEDR